jgi:DUF1365 family protein
MTALPALESALYVGRVTHFRSRPKRNEFSYGIYFLYVDVERLDELAAGSSEFGHNGGPGRARVYDVEHGPRDGSPLRPWFDGVLARAGLESGPEDHLMLLTFPHVGVWKFYPASFWYCLKPDGSPRAILAEVQNTYGEHHDYLLHGDGAPMTWEDHPKSRKVFHVSPFIPMDAEYTFTFTQPGDSLSVRIDDVVEGSPLLLARVDLERRPLDDEQLRAVMREYGPMSRRAAALIGYQAVRLLAKGIRFLGKPGPPQEEISL